MTRSIDLLGKYNFICLMRLLDSIKLMGTAKVTESRDSGSSLSAPRKIMEPTKTGENNPSLQGREIAEGCKRRNGRTAFVSHASLHPDALVDTTIDSRSVPSSSSVSTSQTLFSLPSNPMLPMSQCLVRLINMHECTTSRVPSISVGVAMASRATPYSFW